MKKVLNIQGIANELEGASAFFKKPATSPPAEIPAVEKVPTPISDSPIIENLPVPVEEPEIAVKPKQEKTKVNEGDTVTPRYRDTTVSRYHDTTTPSIYGVAIEIVRKAVKEFGKEAATHRFTEVEKKEIADLIYTYKNRGIKTSENEITRIAVNYVIKDYKENGESSVLHKILKALNE